MHGGDENAYKILTGNPERLRPHGKSRCRWEHIVKMGLEETGCQSMVLKDFLLHGIS
jgi:hypothetical protein